MLIHAVGRAAVSQPRCVIVKYIGREDTEDIDLALVGKGVTFDTGGLNLPIIKNINQYLKTPHIDIDLFAGNLAEMPAFLSLARQIQQFQAADFRLNQTPEEAQQLDKYLSVLRQADES